MKRTIRILAALTAIVVAGFVRPAHAVNPEALDITVSISATKSLTVNVTYYNFGSQSVSANVVSGSAIVVTNNSTALIETYTIQGANAPSTEAGTSWTLASSPGADIYALAAQFSTAAPSNADGSWLADDLNNLTPVVASATDLGNGTAGESGLSVLPTATRNLWFRLKTPTAISDPGNHKATLTLAVN